MNIMKWFSPFKGIATKYLEKYLSFFILFNLYKPNQKVNNSYNDENLLKKIKDDQKLNKIKENLKME